MSGENNKEAASAAKSRKKISGKNGVLVFSFTAAGILLAVAAGALVAKADFTEFLAASCSGSWANPERAAGAPEAGAGAPADSFNAGNSAVFAPQVGSQITCSGFDGSFDENTRVVGAKVRLSWLFKYPEMIKPEEEAPIENPAENAVPESPVSEPPAEDSEAPASEPEEKPAETPAPLPETPALPPAEPAPEAAPEPAIEPLIEEIDSAEPQAWLIKKVFAEESPQVRAELIFDNLEKFLQFDYSLDGEVWLPVEDAQLNIPILTWEDARRLQIRITGLRSGEDLPDVYLDSLWLEVEQSPVVEPEEESLADQVENIAEQVGEAIADIPEAVESLVQQSVEEVPQITEMQQAIKEPEKPKPVLTFALPNKNIADLLASVSEVLEKEKFQVSIADEKLNISGECPSSYAAVLLFASAGDIKNDPSRAVINRSVACEKGSFSTSLEASILPDSAPEQEYYLYIGEQEESGPWKSFSGPKVVEIKKIFK